MDDNRASAEREHAGEPPRKRRRAKVACAPCRERKRKCDGHVPCNTCAAFEYECYPVDGRRGRKQQEQQQQQQRTSHAVTLDSSPTSSSAITNTSVNGLPSFSGGDGHTAEKPAAARAHLQSLEANSGAAFVRTLGLKIDPQNAPRLRMFGWNTGDRLAGYPPGQVRPITALLSRSAMFKLAQIFMKKVAIVYGVIQSDVLFDKINKRWAGGPLVIDAVDQVLCGVAALGLLFSEPNPQPFEPDLVESARSLLEQNSLLSPPPIDTVTGWVLRVAYLRMTSKPHVTWLGSCTLMHVVEAARIHQEAPSHTVFEESSETVNVEIRRRLYGMALHLNIWASFDLGRTQVALPNVTTKPLTPTPTPGDFTSSLLGLIPLTESLDPNRPRSPEALESDLSELLALNPIEEPPAAMAHVNLTLCIFRRLRAQRPVSNYVDKLLELAKRGLQAARTMVDRYTPWHHVANIPFQIVCFLISIDSRPSLSMLNEAMSTLKQVRDCWNTPHMQEAYDTAYLLILLHQRRKDEDARELRGILDMHLVPGPTVTAGQTTDDFPKTLATDESLWLDNLFTNIPGLKEFDMDQFLIDDLDFTDLRLPLV